MKANEIVKNIMSNKNITQSELTKMLNFKAQSAVSGVLNRDMKVSTLVKFLSALDCELVIRNKTDGNEQIVSE